MSMSLFNSFSVKPQRYGVFRTLEAGNGFLELQDGFMRFLKHHAFGASAGESLHVDPVFGLPVCQRKHQAIDQAGYSS
jgi:hypothetical protein